MAAEQGPLSGFRDMLADTILPREKMLDTIRDACELHGFMPLKTPAIERLETLTGKYGEEGDRLMYRFKDNGGRNVALRYDMTVPLARVVGQHNNELPKPWYKRYAVGEVWRGESPQAGRYREFTQFDADIVGSASPLADAEVIEMVASVMAALGAEAQVRVNNRLVLDALVAKANIADGLPARRFVGSIDKVEKIGVRTVLTEIQKDHGAKAAELADTYLRVTGTTQQRLADIANLLEGLGAAETGLDNLKQVFTILEANGRGPEQVIFDQTIARGLDYYTGIIFETTLKKTANLGSVCSGGRYDHLIKALGGPDLPAVGLSFGVDRLFDGLRQLKKLQEAKTPTKVLITNFDNQQASTYFQIATGLRNAGIATEVVYDSVKLGKQLASASKQGIPYVIVLGPEELSNNTAKIKSMHSGEQIDVPIGDIVSAVKQLSSLEIPG